MMFGGVGKVIFLRMRVWSWLESLVGKGFVFKFDKWSLDIGFIE